MRAFFLYLMSLLYVAAGIFHFVKPGFYKRMMPPFVPYHMPVIYISGVLEIVFGLLLIPESTRPAAAWCIIALLIAVFPANIQMAMNFWYYKNPQLWMTIVRLPLQIFLIWWAWIYTKDFRA